MASEFEQSDTQKVETGTVDQELNVPRFIFWAMIPDQVEQAFRGSRDIVIKTGKVTLNFGMNAIPPQIGQAASLVRTQVDGFLGLFAKPEESFRLAQIPVIERREEDMTITALSHRLQPEYNPDQTAVITDDEMIHGPAEVSIERHDEIEASKQRHPSNLT